MKEVSKEYPTHEWTQEITFFNYDMVEKCKHSFDIYPKLSCLESVEHIDKLLCRGVNFP